MMSLIRRQKSAGCRAGPAARLRSRGGFTLAESMVAVVIVLLMSGAMAAGVQFAVRQYNQSMTLSESRVLCSTLTDIIRGELSNVENKVYVKTDGGNYKLTRYFSRTYAISSELTQYYSVEKRATGEGESFVPVTYGELMLGAESGGTVTGRLLLSSAAYSLYDLKAKVDITVFCDGTDVKRFHVILDIQSPDQKVLRNEFDVLPLNDVKAEAEP